MINYLQAGKKEMIRKLMPFVVAALVFGTVGLGAPGQISGAQPAAQAGAGITPNGVIGEVKAIDAAGKQMIVKSDGGSLVTVLLTDKTEYLRTAPGQKDLTNAAKISLGDINEGDRVYARGHMAADLRSVPALKVIVMTKADIAKKHEEERAEWRRRGVLGIISSLNSETKEITISSRSMGGAQSVIIPVTDKVEMRRYAPDSIKFADAKPSKFEELKPGDQLRALGDGSADGTHFAAEKIVTGSFRMVAGTVTAVDAASNEIKIKDLQSKESLTVAIKQDAMLRQLPPLPDMMGMFIGVGQRAGGPGGQGAQSSAGQTPPPQSRQRPAQGEGGGPRQPRSGGMRMGGGGFNLQDFLERQPAIGLADLKVGDTIVVSSTQGADPARLTAITLVNGVDTLLNMLAARQKQGGRPATGAAGADLSGFGPLGGIGLP